MLNPLHRGLAESQPGLFSRQYENKFIPTEKNIRMAKIRAQKQAENIMLAQNGWLKTLQSEQKQNITSSTFEEEVPGLPKRPEPVQKPRGVNNGKPQSMFSLNKPVTGLLGAPNRQKHNLIVKGSGFPSADFKEEIPVKFNANRTSQRVEDASRASDMLLNSQQFTQDRLMKAIEERMQVQNKPAKVFPVPILTTQRVITGSGRTARVNVITEKKETPIVVEDVQDVDEITNMEEETEVDHTDETDPDMLEKPEETPFPIDVVFTYVRDTDNLREQRENYTAKIKGANVPTDNGTHRFADHDELKFALRSVYKYIPWVRRIYVIVHDQEVMPSWMHLDRNGHHVGGDGIPSLTLIRHTLLFGQHRSHLPTFNSQAIECHLHRIPDLSETFIYMNDDFFIGKDLQWSDFFTGQGHPVYSLTGFLPTGVKSDSKSKHACAYINVQQLLDKMYPRKRNTSRQYPAHQACPLLKSTFDEMWTNAISSKSCVRTSQSRFRENDNIYPIGLIIYMNIYQGKFEKREKVTVCHQLASLVAFLTVAKKIASLRPDLFCINDNNAATARAHQMATKFLESYFPEKSPVEKLK